MYESDSLLKEHSDRSDSLLSPITTGKADENLHPKKTPFDTFFPLASAPVFITDEANVIREKPFQAETVVENIINQKMKGNEDRFLEIIDLLLVYNRCWLAYRLSLYAQSICEKKGRIMAALIESMIELDSSLECFLALFPSIDGICTEYSDYRLKKAVCYLCLHIAKKTVDSDTREPYINLGLRYAADLKNLNPRNEFGYYLEIKLLQLTNPLEARRILQRYVLMGDPTELVKLSSDSQETLLCPRCCKLLIDQYLVQEGLEIAFELIQEVAIKGYRDSAQLSLQERPPKEQNEILYFISYFDRIIEQVTSISVRWNELQKIQSREVTSPPRQMMLQIKSDYIKESK